MDGADERRTDDLWVPPGHFYSPIPDLDEVRRDAGRVFRPDRDELPGIDLNVEGQSALFDELVALDDELRFAGAPAERPQGVRYHAQNDSFPLCDAYFLSALLRARRPERVIEVGSGLSSAVLLDTLDQAGIEAQLTFVEPYPERLLEIALPGDLERHRLLRQRVQDVPLSEFEELRFGDVLFIDSSHVVKTGSDVHHLFLEVLPRLAVGVFVHVHDVPFPLEYDPAVVYEGRAWNEAYFLRAFLAFNDAFEIALHPSAFLAHGEAIGRALPERCRDAMGSSIWLRRRR